MPIRVLLADDHIMVRDALAAMLSAQPDIELAALAGNGREAVLQAQAVKPDVALLDVSMPEMNGIEAAAQIRKFVPDCRVIALSALADPCFVSQMAEAGARGYVLKNASGETLVATVRQVHAGRTCLPDGEGPTEGAKKGRALLSQREREVLGRVAAGRRGSQIADDIGVAVKTVDTYRRRIMQKLGLHSQAELVRYALALGGNERPAPAPKPPENLAANERK